MARSKKPSPSQYAPKPASFKIGEMVEMDLSYLRISSPLDEVRALVADPLKYLFQARSMCRTGIIRKFVQGPDGEQLVMVQEKSGIVWTLPLNKATSQ